MARSILQTDPTQLERNIMTEDEKQYLQKQKLKEGGVIYRTATKLLASEVRIVGFRVVVKGILNMPSKFDE